MCQTCGPTFRDLPRVDRMIARERYLAGVVDANAKALQDSLTGDPADAWQRLAVRYQGKMRALTSDLSRELISQAEWRRRFDAILREMHTAAHGAGQSMATDQVLFSVSSRVGQRVADLESAYLQGYYQDLLDGRYTDDEGALKVEQMLNRMALYVLRSRGTAAEGFAMHGKEWQWILGGAEDHCEDCPVLAAGGPYDRSTLYTHPGSGDTPCLGNCKCYLVNDKGAVGPLPFGVTGIL